MKKTTLTLAVTILACCWAVDAHGHGMSLFASHDGKTITGTAEYHAGVPVVDAEVTITAGDESGWWKTRTDQQGNFIVNVRPHDSYLVMVDAGGGHRAKTKIAGVSKNKKTSSAVLNVQVEELRREIHELKNTIQFRDILGGIGYILGLVGIAMYFKAKERRA